MVRGPKGVTDEDATYGLRKPTELELAVDVRTVCKARKSPLAYLERSGMKKNGKLKVGDWVKYRAGGPMLAHDVIGEVVGVAGYIDLLVHDKTVVISPSAVLEVRRK